MLGAAINHKQLSNLLFTNPPATIEADFLLSSNLLKVNSQEEKTHDFFYQQLIIPLSNSEGEIVSFAGRKLNSSNSESKYIYLPNHDGYQKSGLLYNYYYVKSSEEKECYLVEGFFDVISLTMAGVSNSLALLGTSLTEEQTKLLSNLKKRIVLFLDGDRAGHEATVTITKKLLSREIDCEIVATDYQSDPDEIFRSQGVTAVNSLIKTRENPYKFIINYYYNHLEINHNPQRITLFIEEMAKIFAKFKLSSQNFVIEIISELTG
jgi:DNA primase